MKTLLPKTLLTTLIFLISLNINAFGQLEVSFDSDTLFGCSGFPLQLNPDVSGGIAPYQYLWSTGDTAASLNVLLGNDTLLYQITVTDDAGKTASANVLLIGLPECVWPGDANGSARADNLDLLTLGRTFNTKGIERPNAHLNWAAQAAPSWTHSLPGGANYAHSDVNGNGYIDAADQSGIEFNYLVPQDAGFSPVNTQTLSQPLFLAMPIGNYQAGDSVKIEVRLGNSISPAQNVYGVAFSFDYDPAIVDSGSIKINFNSSWIAAPGQRLTLSKNFYDVGQLDAAITRTNKINTNGFGRIAEITVMIDDITGKTSGILNYQFLLTNITLIDALGQPIPVSTEPSTLSVVLGNEPAIDQAGLEIFPNPVTDHLNIVLNPDLGITRLVLRDLSGKLIKRQVIQRGQLSTGINTATLPNGMYMLELTSGENAYWHKIQKTD